MGEETGVRGGCKWRDNSCLLMSSKPANLCTQSHGYRGRKRLKD